MKVFITGGAGFLGGGILRRIAQGKLNWEATVFSRDETKQEECTRRYPFARYIIGDVKDLDLLTVAMMGHDVVIHAAAIKYIPEAEINAIECINVNVKGSYNVVKAARTAGIERVVGISSDKAVQPVNIYGCSKMVMERMFADTSRYEDPTAFTCVRYGNVVGSTGSVIPLFKRQYEQLGRVQITNPDMTRFWMSIDEAIDLIEVALEKAIPGAIIVPTARAMKISDVAKAAVKDDVEMEIIGERPGEKLHEQLIHYEESVRIVLRQEPFFHHELFPPGTKAGKDPFTLASHLPNDWMSVETMRELIVDAQEV